MEIAGSWWSEAKHRSLAVSHHELQHDSSWCEMTNREKNMFGSFRLTTTLFDCNNQCCFTFRVSTMFSIESRLGEERDLTKTTGSDILTVRIGLTHFDQFLLLLASLPWIAAKGIGLRFLLGVLSALSLALCINSNESRWPRPTSASLNSVDSSSALMAKGKKDKEKKGGEKPGEKSAVVSLPSTSKLPSIDVRKVDAVRVSFLASPLPLRCSKRTLRIWKPESWKLHWILKLTKLPRRWPMLKQRMLSSSRNWRSWWVPSK